MIMDSTHLGPDTADYQHHHDHHDHHLGSPKESICEEFSTPLPSRPATPAIMGDPNADYGPRRGPRKLILCFDGTGNKFRGDDSDSNILKIYRMLDRTTDDQYHYYQPGIGTYVVSKSLSHTGVRARFKSWYAKAKDSAIGSSFDEHVVGGYRFLMRFYSPGDEIYIFGFSRGAYIARFLAEMLDHVGLLSHGNEEMVSFAWKAFSQWQRRRGGSSSDERARQKKREMYAFLRGFRETFSRPTRRIRFLGLFDTVNSVPQFETAWMERSRFPYTARSSARVIRHAVSIDERRAKFRQDLIYQSAAAVAAKKRMAGHHHLHHVHHQQDGSNGVHHKLNHMHHDHHGQDSTNTAAKTPESKPNEPERGRATLGIPDPDYYDDDEPGRYRTRPRRRPRSRSGQTRPSTRGLSTDARSRTSFAAGTSDRCPSPYPLSTSAADPDLDQDACSESDSSQDIDEIWFAGGHADVGGGWDVPPDSKSASHVPLAWMVREAMRAGLSFDMDKVRAMGCVDWADEMDGEEAVERGRQRSEEQEEGREEKEEEEGKEGKEGAQRPKPPIIPDIKIRSPGEGSTLTDLTPSQTPDDDGGGGGLGEKDSRSACSPPHAEPGTFHHLLQKAHTSPLHDSLVFGGGLPTLSVLAWRAMEYLPFRRMDLRGDGSWKPIRWPLPCGEVRDIPRDARVHGSVIRRMRLDEKYRPGNLIVGGGGRGCRVAPRELGMGEWVCVGEEGDPIGEVWVRRDVGEGDGGGGKGNGKNG